MSFEQEVEKLTAKVRGPTMREPSEVKAMQGRIMDLTMEAAKDSPEKTLMYLLLGMQATAVLGWVLGGMDTPKFEALMRGKRG